MPAIASLEDLKMVRRDFRSMFLVVTPYALRFTVNGKWRRIGWKNVCKLWLQERTPEQLKGEAV